jgi:hypothetical protein
MINATEREREDAGLPDPPEVAVADAGYWNELHTGRPRHPGITLEAALPELIFLSAIIDRHQRWRRI